MTAGVIRPLRLALLLSAAIRGLPRGMITGVVRSLRLALPFNASTRGFPKGQSCVQWMDTYSSEIDACVCHGAVETNADAIRMVNLLGGRGGD